MKLLKITLLAILLSPLLIVYFAIMFYGLIAVSIIEFIEGLNRPHGHKEVL